MSDHGRMAVEEAFVDRSDRSSWDYQWSLDRGMPFHAAQHLASIHQMQMKN